MFSSQEGWKSLMIETKFSWTLQKLLEQKFGILGFYFGTALYTAVDIDTEIGSLELSLKRN